ncbi:MAG: hypothetical protein U0263_21400 [Polyangiaceae bacterium]
MGGGSGGISDAAGDAAAGSGGTSGVAGSSGSGGSLDDGAVSDAGDASGGGPTMDFAGCPPGTIQVTGQFGKQDLHTETFGAWGSDQIISFQLIADTPMDHVASASWAEFTGGSTVRDFSLSTHACDFSAANAVPGPYGGKVNGTYTTPTGSYRAGTSLGGTVNLLVGEKYYWNMRNPPDSCPSGSCNMVGGFPK